MNVIQKMVEDIQQGRVDYDEWLDHIASTVQPGEHTNIEKDLSGAVIKDCAFFYECAEDKCPASIRLMCITPGGDMCLLEFGHDSIDGKNITRYVRIRATGGEINEDKNPHEGKL